MSLEGLQALASIGSSAVNVTRSVAPLVTSAADVAGRVGTGVIDQRAQEYNAQIAELEAGIGLQSAARSDLNARIARNAAGIEVGRILEAGRKVQGEQAAITAKSGLVVTEGSPLLAQLETIKRAHEDAVLARWKGDVTATGFEAEAAQKRTQAQALQAEAWMRRTLGRRMILEGITRGMAAARDSLTRLQSRSPADIWMNQSYRGGWTPSDLRSLEADTGFRPIG